MKIIFSLMIMSVVFSNESIGDISFRYSILGKLQPKQEAITVLEDSSKIRSNDEIRLINTTR